MERLRVTKKEWFDNASRLTKLGKVIDVLTDSGEVSLSYYPGRGHSEHEEWCRIIDRLLGRIQQTEKTTRNLSRWVGHIDDYLVEESIRVENVVKDIARVRILCGLVVIGSLLLWVLG